MTAPGLERVTAAELSALGLTPTGMEEGGVSFTADHPGLYLANLQLRTASRVLVRLATFEARGFPELERHARKVPWQDFLGPGVRAVFRVTSKKSKLYHAGAIEERLARTGGRADGQTGGEFVQEFVVRVFRDRLTISADSSGDLLHLRGYRLATAKAPLRETLAAAMLLGAGWDPRTPLVDPFCGSGTIPIEAALLARRIPPGRHRSFAFMRWPGFDAASWQALLARADAESLAGAPAPIVGADRDAGAIRASVANAERAGVSGDIAFRQLPLSSLQAPEGPGLLVTNPPYGVRVGEADHLRDLYARLGRVLSERFSGWTAVMLSANRALEGQTGLSWEEIWRTRNGGIPVRLVRTPCQDEIETVTADGT
ncbi:MAG TPA: class I SAM-dependent RNA methyltransferase [Gemmatimonadales bacterium]